MLVIPHGKLRYSAPLVGCFNTGTALRGRACAGAELLFVPGHCGGASVPLTILYTLHALREHIRAGLMYSASVLAVNCSMWEQREMHCVLCMICRLYDYINVTFSL